MEWVCYNGDFFPADRALFSSQHKGVKYGDGVFETIKIFRGKILLSSLHFERLLISLKLLQIDSSHLDKNKIEQNILSLCEKNNCSDCGRVRLTVFRNDAAEYLIEAFPLSTTENELNSEGWKIGIFPFAKKNNDAYANIKSVNYQAYVLADLYAKEKGWDEAIVLNASNNIADGSKTNIFLIKEGVVFTPALHQGCVNGIMRRFLIGELKGKGYRVHQAELREEDLFNADEVFCTNAIRGIRWVKEYKHKEYSSTATVSIYNAMTSSLSGSDK